MLNELCNSFILSIETKFLLLSIFSAALALVATCRHSSIMIREKWKRTFIHHKTTMTQKSCTMCVMSVTASRTVRTRSKKNDQPNHFFTHSLTLLSNSTSPAVRDEKKLLSNNVTQFRSTRLPRIFYGNFTYHTAQKQNFRSK